MRVLDTLVPSRLGRDFRWLFASFTAANLADGILLAVGPLLASSITDDPVAIASALMVQQVPWVVFGVVAGAIIDRVRRRRLMVAVHLARAAAVATLAAAIAAGALSLPLLYGALFVIGTGEAFGDNAASTLVAVVTPRRHLGVANARLQGAGVVTNRLAGPPLGAALFALAALLPFAGMAGLFALAGVLVTRVRHREPDRDHRSARHLGREIREGLRWLWSHPAMRTLALLIAAFNITFGARAGVLVIYAQEVQGLDAVGFGLLLASSAVGGLLGATIFSRVEHLGYARLLRVGLCIETLSHAGLALAPRPWVAGAVLFAFGVHATIWSTLANTIRQRVVPERLLGRVTSTYFLGVFGALVVGTALGGVIASRWGILAPFWFGFVGAAVTTVLVWPSMDHLGAAGEHDATV